ncbi:trafficking protein particle complex subunit 2-like protein isoform X1 [Phocoena sinus]|uniref:trafficking protein particle complex subunit 2-like protein isoform X1 n=1 Tax=Phocoena sinus TaxID=42100 RepID=UPI0013C4E9C9|nr:trafficking protein particle complex subunit 2-like protein isoform X1 [Phocoena sinus]
MAVCVAVIAKEASAPGVDPCHFSRRHPFLAELPSLHPQCPHGERAQVSLYGTHVPGRGGREDLSNGEGPGGPEGALPGPAVPHRGLQGVSSHLAVASSLGISCSRRLCSYGYVTNSKVKFVMVVDSSNTALRDNEIRSMFRKLHNSYTDVMCNPFYTPGDRIQSRAFDGMVTSMMIQVC